MQVQNKNSPHFGSFYRISGEIEKNMLANRAILEAGGVFPWLLQTNNSEEKKEKLNSIGAFCFFAFLAPLITVPISNRIAMRMTGLTKSLLANNHKAVQLSYAHLVSSLKTEEGIAELAKKASTSPFESFLNKIIGKKDNNTLDVQELLKNSNNNYEALRNKLMNAKLGVLCSDLFITGATIGGLGFMNNYLTKKRSGKTGFSAELEMADSSIIADRADYYEQTKKKRILAFLAGATAISFAFPLALKIGLSSQSAGKFNDFIKKSASKFDYRKGIYMSRLAMFIGLLVQIGGFQISSRTEAERKDWGIRLGMSTPAFMGGDIVVGGALAGLCDKIFKTDITVKKEKPGLFRRIFPETKPIEQLSELAKTDKNAARTLKYATAVYWGNLAAVAACLAFVVPYLCNKMIRNDVAQDVAKRQKNNEPMPVPQAPQETNLVKLYLSGHRSSKVLQP